MNGICILIIFSQYINILIAATCQDNGWQIEPQCGDIPPISSSSNMLSFGSDLYLILGFVECFNISLCDNEFYPFNIVYKYDTNSLQWTKITVSGTDFPPERAYSGVDIMSKTGNIYMYGGIQYDIYLNPAKTTTYDDLWMYSIKNNKWTEIIAANQAGDPNIPPALSFPGLLVNEDYIYLFGGLTATFEDINTLYRFSFETLLWDIIEPTGDTLPPPGHTVFGMQWASDMDSFFVFGGEDIESFVPTFLDDLYEYDIDTNEWNKLLPTTSLRPNVQNHGGVVVDKNDNIYVFFGEAALISSKECFTDTVINSGNSVNNETYVYNNNKWHLLQPNTVPPRLKRPAHVYNKKQNKIYVYGGYDIVCQQPQGKGVDIYNRQMYSLSASVFDDNGDDDDDDDDNDDDDDDSAESDYVNFGLFSAHNEDSKYDMDSITNQDQEKNIEIHLDSSAQMIIIAMIAFFAFVNCILCYIRCVKN